MGGVGEFDETGVEAAAGEDAAGAVVHSGAFGIVFPGENVEHVRNSFGFERMLLSCKIWRTENGERRTEKGAGKRLIAVGYKL